MADAEPTDGVVRKDVIIYVQAGCVASRRAMEDMVARGMVFTVKDVSLDEGAATELVNLGSIITPTIVINGKVLAGFDSDDRGGNPDDSGGLGSPGPAKPKSPISRLGSSALNAMIDEG